MCVDDKVAFKLCDKHYIFLNERAIYFLGICKVYKINKVLWVQSIINIQLHSNEFLLIYWSKQFPNFPFNTLFIIYTGNYCIISSMLA